MTDDQKINWLIYIAGGMVTALACAIVADQIKTNKALETPSPVASQSASSQPLAIDSSPVVQIPESAPSSKKPIPTLKLDITIEGKRDPIATTCFDVTTCDCALDQQTCHDAKRDLDYVCSKGLVFLKEEHLLWGKKLFHDVYRDDCRPPTQPQLKLCTIGLSCAYQSLKEQEICFGGADDRLSICLCGVVFDFSTPQLRIALATLGCVGQSGCEPPPTPPIHL